MKKTCSVVWNFSWLLSVLWLTGCAGTGYKKADTMAAGMQTANREILAERYALDLTFQKLDNLVDEPAMDPAPQFKRFERALNELIASKKRADRAGQRMQQQTAAYFREWDLQLAQMNYEVIRDQSAARKTAVSNQMDAILRRYQETQDVLPAMISYLEDIRKALSTDLTGAGLDNVKNVVRNAADNSRKVQGALAQVAEELAAASDRMSVALGEKRSRVSAVAPPTEASRAGTSVP